MLPASDGVRDGARQRPRLSSEEAKATTPQREHRPYVGSTAMPQKLAGCLIRPLVSYRRSMQDGEQRRRNRQNRRNQLVLPARTVPRVLHRAVTKAGFVRRPHSEFVEIELAEHNSASVQDSD